MGVLKVEQSILAVVRVTVIDDALLEAAERAEEGELVVIGSRSVQECGSSSLSVTLPKQIANMEGVDSSTELELLYDPDRREFVYRIDDRDDQEDGAGEGES